MANETLTATKPRKRLVVEVAPELFEALREEAAQISNRAGSYSVSDLVRRLLDSHVSGR